ncbi:MAG: helix-hairpin-helix domain-containing protein [Verrucomicrobiaceae bacterium]|nr:helix-hairpin-helix domain-containing protein [Verrucomicrobiaceae bacterium]
MSDAFNKLLEERQARNQQSAQMQRWVFTGLIILGVALVAFIMLRGDPSKQPVNVNTASVAQLATLPSVGPAIAEKIVKGRPYSKPEDLLKVPGIGEKTLEKMRPRLKFEAK